MSKKLVCAAFLCISASSVALAADDCKNAQSQLAMNTCAARDYEQADARLNKTYKELVSKADEEHRRQLKELQFSWIKFRDLQCDFEADQYAGGSMQPMVRASCLSQMTKQRTKDLKALLEEGGSM